MKRKSYAVFGLGKFGTSMAIELAKTGVDVLAVDIKEENVHDVADIVTYAAQADVCDAESMGKLGVSNMDGVVVAITGNLDASIMGTILAKEAGVPFVLAKSKDETHTKILEKVGADRVIVPEKESGIRLARSIASGNFIDFIELSDKVKMVELPIKQDWIGKTLRELDLRQKMGINVIAIRDGSDVQVNYDPDIPLQSHMSMWITVEKNNISKLG